jgi:NADH dehydrogenase
VRLPDSVARLQGIALGLLPGKPFTLDNFRTLSVDGLCRENGLAQLAIEPQRMAAVLPTYLGEMSPTSRLNRFRSESDR